MKTMTRLVAIVVLSAFIAAASHAIEPAYSGKRGNPEEPALRVYKAFWRGLKAVKYQTVKSYHEGNEKVPGWGSVEALRGVRRGTVELVGGTYLGMAGRMPRKVEEVGKANEYIDHHERVRMVSDRVPSAVALTLVGVPPLGVIAMSTALGATQYWVDGAPEREEQELRETAPEVFSARRLPTIPQTYVVGQGTNIDKGPSPRKLKKLARELQLPGQEGQGL